MNIYNFLNNKYKKDKKYLERMSVKDGFKLRDKLGGTLENAVSEACNLATKDYLDEIVENENKCFKVQLEEIIDLDQFYLKKTKRGDVRKMITPNDLSGYLINTHGNNLGEKKLFTVPENTFIIYLTELGKLGSSVNDENFFELLNDKTIINQLLYLLTYDFNDSKLGDIKYFKNRRIYPPFSYCLDSFIEGSNEFDVDCRTIYSKIKKDKEDDEESEENDYTFDFDKKIYETNLGDIYFNEPRKDEEILNIYSRDSRFGIFNLPMEKKPIEYTLEQIGELFKNNFSKGFLSLAFKNKLERILLKINLHLNKINQKEINLNDLIVLLEIKDLDIGDKFTINKKTREINFLSLKHIEKLNDVYKMINMSSDMLVDDYEEINMKHLKNPEINHYKCNLSVNNFSNPIKKYKNADNRVNLRKYIKLIVTPEIAKMIDEKPDSLNVRGVDEAFKNYILFSDLVNEIRGDFLKQIDNKIKLKKLEVSELDPKNISEIKKKIKEIQQLESNKKNKKLIILTTQCRPFRKLSGDVIEECILVEDELMNILKQVKKTEKEEWTLNDAFNQIEEMRGWENIKQLMSVSAQMKNVEYKGEKYTQKRIRKNIEVSEKPNIERKKTLRAKRIKS